MGNRCCAMKRWRFKVVVFLLLGAIVNVGVAWGCALGLPLLTANGPFGRSGATGDRAPYWVVDQLQRPGAMRYVWMDVPVDFDNAPGIDLDIFEEIEPVDLDGLPRWSRLDYSKPPPQKYRGWGVVFIDDGRGWPLLAMSSFSGLGVDPVADAFLAKSSDGFSVPDSLRSQPLFADIEAEWFNRPIVPLRPIWAGFAINTIFYAAILWLLALVPFTVRRMIRRRRGRCIKCGYDLHGHSGGAVCPECGVPRIERASHLKPSPSGRGFA